jgi:hypothetical protein
MLFLHLIFKTLQLQVHPPLNILAVPDWLNVKFYCFLIGPKVTILNNFNLIGSHLCHVGPIVVTRVNPFMRLTDFP